MVKGQTNNVTIAVVAIPTQRAESPVQHMALSAIRVTSTIIIQKCVGQPHPSLKQVEDPVEVAHVDAVSVLVVAAGVVEMVMDQERSKRSRQQTKMTMNTMKKVTICPV